MPSGPKTNKYSNIRSEEARRREEERLQELKKAREAAAEDAKWVDTDAKMSKRIQKREEQERKEKEKVARDEEKRKQLEEENSDLLKNKAPAGVTKRQEQKLKARMHLDIVAAYDRERDKARRDVDGIAGAISHHTHARDRLSGNGDHQSKVQLSNARAIFASDEKVEAARQGISSHQQEIPEDRHIAKRAKVLYKAFYDEQIDKVKEERPSLRRTQYNDLIWEMWKKSPLNPFVLRSEARDRARLEADRKWVEGEDLDEEDDETKNTK